MTSALEFQLLKSPISDAAWEEKKFSQIWIFKKQIHQIGRELREKKP